MLVAENATTNAISVSPLTDAVVQLVRAMARRQARIDARIFDVANDNRPSQ